MLEDCILQEKKEEEGFGSCEESVNVEVQSLDKYLSKSKDGEKGFSEVEDQDAF